MFREQQRLRPASTGGGGQSYERSEAAARRSSWQQQQRAGRVPIFGLPNQSNQLDQLDLDDREEDELIRLGRDEEQDEEDWRQAAQMLTEHDERRLLASRQPRSSDVLDMVAPINRRLQQANQRARRSVTPTAESPSRASPRQQQQEQQQQQQVPSSRKLAQRMVFTSHKQLGGKTKQKKQKSRRAQNEDEEDNERRKLREDRHDDDDDNSSLSFAQSGCHSILSAWRIKAANKAARLAAASRASSSGQQHQQQSTQSRNATPVERPQSVLSQASSVGKKSAASTAYTARSSRLPAAQIARIPLGPKSAQHFVTNTRRRRRANELIMNTLEARRRALSLNRSNLASSLFGSESYLGGVVGVGANHPTALDDYQRLSMSPSPLANNSHQLARQSPSPFASPARKPAALSDLGGGGRQSPAMLAQRNKLLAAARNQQQPGRQVAPTKTKPTSGSQLSASKKTLSHSSLGSDRSRPPPLAKLDQNSSDLCSSNDSSSGRDEDDEGDEDSDGSQFTQLVTSELSPSCLLLEQSVPTGGERQLASRARPQPAVRPHVPPPRPPERTKRKQVESKTQAAHPKTPQVQAQVQQQVSTSEEDDKNGNKLRRGALKRDSIRRLRLNRQQRSIESEQYATTKSPSRAVTPISSSNQSTSRYDDNYEVRQQRREREREQEELASKHLRPLSKARKLDIENNPFLNRHHFRTLSTRSTDSKQSYASQQAVAASRRTPLAAVMQSSNEDEPVVGRPPTFRRGASSSASARAATGSRQLEPDVSLEMPKVDMENVRQVERMLRNMKPNEVVRSGRRELSTGQQVATVGRSLREPPAVETEKQDENVFKTTTRLVRAEGARSSDDVKFDQAGNRQQRQLDERWRHERTVPMRLADGSVFSEHRFLSDRVERVVRSDGTTLGRGISPPAEFSDTKRPPPPPVVERSVHSSQARQVSAPPQKFVPTLPPRPSDRFGDRPQVDESRFWDRTPPPKPSRARSEERPKQPPVSKPEQQRQRPPVVPRASKPSTATTTSRSSEPPKQFALDTAKAVRASLPQFERTADDEFRKRVDQLRQMARANLEASEQRQAQEARARRDKMKLVKPMSTNWSGPAVDRPKSPDAGEEVPLTSRNLARNLSAPATRSPPPATRRGVRATDLDDMLMADRYQRPLRRTPSPSTPLARPAGGTTTTWRRSNSSLASLSGGGAVARTSQQARPTSPAFGLPKPQAGSERAISPPSSVLSVEPRGDDSSATPMRVVVRERAAPRLDFAKVEQRPPVQHVRPAVVAPQPPTPTRAYHRQQAPTQQQQQGAGPSGLGRPAGASGQSRSPEFGQAAASSNDDSAIASSVSSPSPLSSYVASQPQRPAGLQQQQTSRPPPPPAIVGTQTQQQPVRATSPARAATSVQAARPPPVATTTSLDRDRITASANGGALQSILRRQQLAAASSFAQQASGRSTPTSPIGRAPTPPTFMQQMPAPTRQPQRQFEAADQQRQMPPTNQQQSLPAKRVHFNDRTSIRSFESISSDTDSNTTAIQKQQHQSSNLDDLRQQVGSPDSMGSGSTSRLSNDSPAFGGEFRRGGGGGAAIYAIRGDPELEQPPVGQQQQQHPVATVQPPRQFHQQMVSPQQPQQQFYPSRGQQSPASHQTRPMMLMPQRVQYGQPSPQARPTGGYIPTALTHQPQVLTQLSPLAGSIRMTAPPTIKTSPQVPASSYQTMSPTSGLMSHATHQPLQSPYMSRPQHSPVVVMVAPQQQQHGPLSAGRPAHLVTEADEEDPDYALRLRQAATRRAFNYVQPQQITPQQQPPNAGGGGGGSGQVGVPGTRRQRTDLANFQTEV